MLAEVPGISGDPVTSLSGKLVAVDRLLMALHTASASSDKIVIVSNYTKVDEGHSIYQRYGMLILYLTMTGVRGLQKLAYRVFWLSISQGASLGDSLLAPACPIDKAPLWGSEIAEDVVNAHFIVEVKGWRCTHSLLSMGVIWQGR